MQRVLFARIELWLVLLLLLLAALGAIGLGALALEGERASGRLPRISAAALTVAEIPRNVERLLTDEPMLAFFGKTVKGAAGWTFPQGQDRARRDGYLLLSRYDGTIARHVVELWSLRNWTILWRWQPDSAALLDGVDPGRWHQAQRSSWNPAMWRAIHPILTPEGQLVVKDHQSLLAGLDACGTRLWRHDDTLFHHSSESDGAGGYWLPAVMDPTPITGVDKDFVDDGLGHVGPDGRLLSLDSLTQILLENGFEPRLFTAGVYTEDPVHLNDIQPVLADGRYWKAGDLFLSSRHLSAILLYRPSERRIVWMKSGPWMAQHDIDILDDHRIAVFDNGAYQRRPILPMVNGHSDVAIYDFATDRISRPYGAGMKAANLQSLFEGQQDILPDGSLIAEDENSGRDFLFAADGGLVAEYVNRAEDGKVYRMGWSRYVPQGTGDQALQRLRASPCAAAGG